MYISKYNPSDSLDIEVKVCAVHMLGIYGVTCVQVFQDDLVFNGEVHVANKMEESSTFKFTSSSSRHEMVSKCDVVSKCFNLSFLI